MFFVGAAAVIAAEEEAEAEAERARLIRIRQIRIRRQEIRDTSDPFQLDPEYFRKLYRMPPHVVLILIERLQNHILQNMPGSIPVHVQVLVALRFFAEGGYQKGTGQDHHHPVSQSTVSRCIGRVTDALVDLAPTFIQLPASREERQGIAERFRQYIRIPGVIGLIDCILVRYIRPSENEEAFYNYKGYHAMNVQIISDADFQIRDIRICPGSNNDRFIWQHSEAKVYLEMLRKSANVTHEEGRYYILGDSGYTPSPILLTPVRRAAEGTPEAFYTHQFVRTRCRIEQLFGIWTAVNRGVKRERELCYPKPEKVAEFITASAVLHNFRRIHKYNLPMPGPREDQVPQDIVDIDMGYRAGLAERERLIATYYAKRERRRW